jgi:hypothetical protein
LRPALAYIDKPFDLGYLKRVVAMALRTEADKRDDYSKEVTM